MSENHTVHGEWIHLVTWLRHTRVAEELTYRAMMNRLGSLAAEPPRRELVALLLKRYFIDDEEPMVGTRRRRQSRCFVHRLHGPSTAQAVVARLGLACPELGVLEVFSHPAAAELQVSSAGHQVKVCATEQPPSTSTGRRKKRTERKVAVRTLVGATNQLLLAHDLPYRLVPLLVVENCEIYLGLTLSQATLLDETKALAEPLTALLAFARWQDASLDDDVVGTSRGADQKVA